MAMRDTLPSRSSFGAAALAIGAEDSSLGRSTVTYLLLQLDRTRDAKAPTAPRFDDRDDRAKALGGAC
ncbi:hypothetical protein Tdes44962_MAKER07619 [Teratosphaeria destructans]|uniref:Uncharacterized protein n=1 Tax=Teratosphaeria destructans TaxID=418781 RepID=A0A9W7W5S8_9PEZI|nr:hypothetical protein Tdes44962_MAKER07619 [Teratosphaeria destructans]